MVSQLPFISALTPIAPSAPPIGPLAISQMFQPCINLRIFASKTPFSVWNALAPSMARPISLSYLIGLYSDNTFSEKSPVNST